MANNNQPEITSITSESLQAQIRTLLPSQQGFGSDLMAQNVIVPVIDLTSAAEGSSIAQNLQTALSFDSQTVFTAFNSTVVVVNTAGFYRIFANVVVGATGGAAQNAIFQMSDGLSTKNVLTFDAINGADSTPMANILDFVVFLNAGESLSAISNAASCVISGSSRQIADVNGTLVNPAGFNPQ